MLIYIVYKNFISYINHNLQDNIYEFTVGQVMKYGVTAMHRVP